MKLRVVLSTGHEREVIGIHDPEAWMKSFVGRGTSQLGDWLEVAPVDGSRRTFVRAADVVAVQLTDDDDPDAS
jgi:hypothetical protein